MRMSCRKVCIRGLLMASVASAASGAFASQGGMPDGEHVFAMRCAKCHTPEKLAPQLARRKPDARAAYLERFLTRHYAPDAAERKKLVELLTAAAGKK